MGILIRVNISAEEIEPIESVAVGALRRLCHLVRIQTRLEQRLRHLLESLVTFFHLIAERHALDVCTFRFQIAIQISNTKSISKATAISNLA